jgi:hypothetical protein
VHAKFLKKSDQGFSSYHTHELDQRECKRLITYARISGGRSRLLVCELDPYLVARYLRMILEVPKCISQENERKTIIRSMASGDLKSRSLICNFKLYVVIRNLCTKFEDPSSITFGDVVWKSELDQHTLVTLKIGQYYRRMDIGRRSFPQLLFHIAKKCDFNIL